MADRYEPNNSIATATRLSGASGSIYANIHSAADQDWYRITLDGTPSPTSRIYLDSFDSFYQYIELYNADGIKFRNRAASISLAGVPKGTYYVRVYDTGKYTGSYRLDWDTSVDRYEANDSIAKATKINGASGSLAANIHSASDQDWYRITLDGTGSSESRIGLSKSTGSQRVELYRPDGIKFRNQATSISLSGVPKGTYYVKVYDTAKKASGDYTLTWKTSIMPDKYEANDNLPNAAKISGASGSIAANIHSTGDQDWYQITLDGSGSSASKIALTKNAATQRVELYNASGIKFRNAASSISLSNVPKGTYYVKVYDTARKPSGDYTLTWNTTIKPDQYEANNSLAKATALNGTSGSLAATIHSGADQDWYKITLAGPGSAASKIAFGKSTGTQRMELYNAAGKKARNAAASFSLAGVGKGTYYVKVYDTAKKASGDYTLTWNTTWVKADQYEGNDSLAKARAISGVSGSLAASIHSAADQDWYKFTLGGPGSAASKIAFGKSTGDQRIEIYNASGKKFRNAAASISLAGAPKGVYYAKVYDTAKKVSGDYTLTWNTSYVKPDKYEANDSLARARTISGLTGSLAATIHSSTDQDWYRFALGGIGDGNSKIELSGESSGQVVELYDAAGKKIQDSAVNFLSLKGLAKGTYYAKVYDIGKKASGEYTLNWNTSYIKPDKYEANDSFDKATRISGASGNLAATIHSASDQDWYEFTLTGDEAERSYIEIGQGQYGQRIEVYNAAGKKFRVPGNYAYNKYTGISAYCVGLSGLAKGTYYAKVYDTEKKVSGAYSLGWSFEYLEPDDYEANDSLAKATTIDSSKTNGNIYANIHSATDQDWYKFTLAGTGTTGNRISIWSDYGGAAIELYNAAGKKLRNMDKDNSISLAGLAKGAYYAKVDDPEKKASGGYELSWNTIYVKPDEYEANDSIAVATRITDVSGSLDANIHSGTDQDWYEFTLDGTGSSGDSINLNDWYSTCIELYDASGTKIRTQATSISLQGLAKGTYYAKVYEPSKQIAGDYTLSWNASCLAPDKFEANDSIAKARTISGASGSLNANLHSREDQDWYRITLNATGSQVNAVSFTSNVFGHYMELYDASGNSLWNRSGGDTLSLAGLEKGDYYVIVANQNNLAGNYSLSWNTALSPSILKNGDGTQGNDILCGRSGSFDRNGGNDVVVYNGRNWGDSNIYNYSYYDERGSLTILLSGVDASDVVINDSYIYQKSDPSHSIYVESWDPSRDSIIFGGSLPSFNKYINSASPTAAQKQAAWNEINKATGGVLAS